MKIADKNLLKKHNSEIVDVDSYLRKKDNAQNDKNIKKLLELLNVNPDLTEEMIRPDLRKYFGVVKREYIKQNVEKNNLKSR